MSHLNLGRQPIGKRVAIMGAGGIGFESHPRGVVTGVQPQTTTSERTITLLQRKNDPVGLTLARRGVRMVNGVEYLKVDDTALHTLVNNEPKLFEVDTVIVCA